MGFQSFSFLKSIFVLLGNLIFGWGSQKYKIEFSKCETHETDIVAV